MSQGFRHGFGTGQPPRNHLTGLLPQPSERSVDLRGKRAFGTGIIVAGIGEILIGGGGGVLAEAHGPAVERIRLGRR